MRIMFNNNHVEEFFSISAVPCWKEPKTTRDNPEMYVVSYFIPTCKGNESMYLGGYMLDGTKATYQAATKNFQEIAKQLAVKGYVFDTQFENFEFY